MADAFMDANGLIDTSKFFRTKISLIMCGKCGFRLKKLIEIFFEESSVMKLKGQDIKANECNKNLSINKW